MHRAAKVFGDRRCIVDHLVQTDVAVRGLQFGYGNPCTVGDIEFARPLGSKHLKTHDFFAVFGRQRTRFGDGVGDARNFIEPDMPPVGERNIEHAQIGGSFHRGNGAHRLFGATHVATAAGRFLLHQSQAPRHIDRRHIQRGHFCGIKLNADFAISTANAFNCAEPGHA